MPFGIIIKGIGGFYYVESEGAIYECKARGIFRKDDIVPLPGDRVRLSVIDDERHVGSIDEILPRDSQLVRPAVANIDQVIMVISAKSPSPDLVLLDKLLITAEYKSLRSIICINKIDLDTNEDYKKLVQAYEGAGYRVIPMSVAAGIGTEGLKESLAGRVSVFAGQSGVGKSTILNRVMNSIVMKTGSISEKIERGKHTTRHAELLKLDEGGYIVDTPGFSSFELCGIALEELHLYYPEFNQFLNKCRFAGCSHIMEPSCAVKEAVEKGIIHKVRYEGYIEFYKKLKLDKENVYKKKGRKG